MIIVSILIVVLYFILMLSYSIGMHKLKSPESIPSEYPNFSVIVPFRNEEQKIEITIQSLLNQNYPKNKTEIIFVDDHSTDASLKIVESYMQNHPELRVLTLSADQNGKKEALKKGVKVAQSEFIVSTDADCTHHEMWLSNFNLYFQEFQADFIAAPVLNSNKNSFLTYFQHLEQISLMQVTAGSFGLGSPIMCNGANLAFRKSLFLISESQLESNLSSGDDMFLLLALKQKQKKLNYSIKKESIVYTESPDSLFAFWNQRKRWASKSTKYKDILLIFSSLSIYLTSLSLSALLILSIFDGNYLKPLGFLFISKIVIDLMLLFSGDFLIKTSFFEKVLVTFFQIVYIFYASLIAPFALFGRFEWKARKFRQ